MKLEKKIKNKLEILYKERLNLTDKNRVWIKEKNAYSRYELTIRNQIKIDILEEL